MMPESNIHDVHGNELSEEEVNSLEEYYNELQLNPFMKSNWKTAESRDKWNNILTQAAQMITEIEFHSLLSDLTDRKINIIHYSHGNRQKWLDRLGEHGLQFRDIKSVKSYEGHSNRHFSTTKSDPERISYAAIGKNQDVVDKAHEAEIEMSGAERHRTIGQLLGFPECCIEFFIDSWVGNNKVDNIFSIAKNSGNTTVLSDDGNTIRIDDPEPYTNNLWKGFNWRFTTHTPCSYDCQHTISLGKKRGRVAANIGYTDEVNAVYNWLDKKMEWTGYKGLARLANGDMLGSYQCTPYWEKKKIIWKGEHPSETVRGNPPSGNSM